MPTSPISLDVDFPNKGLFSYGNTSLVIVGLYGKPKRVDSTDIWFSKWHIKTCFHIDVQAY